MGNPWEWGQLGVAGAVAVSLGGVISYVFKLFVSVQAEAMARARAERDAERTEVTRLHTLSEEQQRAVVVTLADVARVMAEVQQMMREREIQAAMEREFDRRGKRRGSDDT